MVFFMSKQKNKALLAKVLPSGCFMLILGVILIGIAFLALFSAEFGAFLVLLIVGTILLLIWPLFMKLRGLPKFTKKRGAMPAPHVVFVVRIGGPIPTGGSVGWLVTWGVSLILLAAGAIIPVTPYLLGSMNFLDLALQASISSLLGYPGNANAATFVSWLPLIVSLGGAFIAGLLARNPKNGIVAGVMIYFFTAIFLFFFGISFLAFQSDLNLVWAFIVTQLAIRWAGGIGLLASLPPVLVLGALGGMVNRKKD
jgi:hypothetical protein